MGTSQACEQCREVKNESRAYGQFQICQEEGRQLALIEKKVESKPGLSNEIYEKLERRTRIKSKHEVRLCRFDVLDQGHEVRIELYYEFMPRTLREYLQELQARGQGMGEKQLFALIYGVQAGLAALGEVGAIHNCINLDTILCRGDYFKVTDVSATTGLSSYQLVLKGDRQQFLSERLLNNLSCTMIKPTDCSVSDDHFSLGLLVLLAACGGATGQFYLWHRSDRVIAASLNYKQIEHCMRLLARNYSSKLVAKVRQLLSEGKGQSEENEPEGGSLTAQLQQLNQDMSRVMNRIRSSGHQTFSSKQATVRNSNYHTPFRSVKD